MNSSWQWTFEWARRVGQNPSSGANELSFLKSIASARGATTVGYMNRTGALRSIATSYGKAAGNYSELQSLRSIVDVLGATPSGRNLGDLNSLDCLRAIVGAVADSSDGGGAPAFDPLTITGLKLWLKADALALANDDPVTTWTDSSGLGNSAAQATVAQKPTYKTGIVNGKPVVRFDGVDDFMVCPAITAAAGLSAFVVWKMTTATNFGMTLVLTDGSSELRQNGANLQMLCGANPISGGVADTAWHVHSFTNNGSNLSELWTDGVSNGTSVTSVACGTPSIGARNAGSFPFNGDIAEILLYDSSLSAGNRQAVEAYLRAKYATP